MHEISTLDVLKSTSNEDLQPLVEYILKAKTTQRLTACEAYKNYQPNHRRYTNEILQEICLFGGNSFANLIRKKEGPEYKELVQDVAKKFGVKKVDSYGLVELEEELILSILRDAMMKSSGQERADMEAILREAGLGQQHLSALLSGSSLLSILGANLAGRVTYQTSAIMAGAIANQVLGHSIRYAATNAAGALASRGVAVFLGPVGWLLTCIWKAIDVAGPAFRVTVPCVLHIAMLRQKMIWERATAPEQEVIAGD